MEFLRAFRPVEEDGGFGVLGLDEQGSREMAPSLKGTVITNVL